MDSSDPARISLGLVELGVADFFRDAFKYYRSTKDPCLFNLNFQNQLQCNRKNTFVVEGVVKTENSLEAPLLKAASVAYQIYMISKSDVHFGKVSSQSSNFELIGNSGVRVSGSNFVVCGPVAS